MPIASTSSTMVMKMKIVAARRGRSWLSLDCEDADSVNLAPWAPRVSRVVPFRTSRLTLSNPEFDELGPIGDFGRLKPQPRRARNGEGFSDRPSDPRSGAAP